MSIFNFLFGGSKAAEKTIEFATDSVKGIGNWIDERKLTDEENVKYSLDAANLNLELVKLSATENSVRSVTRRVLAWLITIFVLLNCQAAIVFTLMGRSDAVKAILDIANAFYIGPAFVAVVTFYFGVQIFRR